MPRPIHSRVALAALATLFVLGSTGCSLGDDASSDATTTSAASTSTTLAGVDAPDADDQAAAEDAVLTIDDVPDGWRSAPARPESTNDPFNNPVDGCSFLRAVREGGTTTAKAPGEELTNDQVTDQMQSSVLVWDAASDARRSISLLADDRTPGCVEQFMKDAAEKDESAPEFSRLDASPITFSAGDQSAGVRIDIALAQSGQTVESVAAIAFVRVGRAVGSVQYTRLGPGFDEDELARYVGILADRLGTFSD